MYKVTTTAELITNDKEQFCFVFISVQRKKEEGAEEEESHWENAAIALAGAVSQS